MKFLLFFLICLFSLRVSAQTDSIVGKEYISNKVLYTEKDEHTSLFIPFSTHSAVFHRAIPLLDFQTWYDPMSYSPIHEGFNANVSLSATMGFGKHSPKGVGFGKNLSLAYLHSFTPRLSFAIGISGTHFTWDGLRYSGIGLTAMLAYRATERLTFYAYGTKSLTSDYTNRLRNAYYGYLPLDGDRIGVAAGYKFSERFHLQLNVEVQNKAISPFYNGPLNENVHPLSPIRR